MNLATSRKWDTSDLHVNQAMIISLVNVLNGVVLCCVAGNDMNGYCDAFNRCMSIDSNGPLSRLKDAIFNPDVYKDIFEWAKVCWLVCIIGWKLCNKRVCLQAHWWLTALICLASSIFFILFVKVFSVHTPSSNPNLPKNRQLMHTVGTLPRTIRRSRSGRRHSDYTGSRPYTVAQNASRGSSGASRSRSRNNGANRNSRHGAAVPKPNSRSRNVARDRDSSADHPGLPSSSHALSPHFSPPRDHMPMMEYPAPPPYSS